MLLMSSVVYSGTIDPDTQDSKYLDYGSKFTSVLRISCYDGVGVSSGSAVVLGPNHIVTAAHVVDGSTSWTVKIKDKNYIIKKIILHPEYKKNVFSNADIAVGFLEDTIVLEHYPTLYEEEDEVGRICSISGWGLTGTFNTGVKISDGKQRAGSNFVDRIEKNVLICSPSKKHEKMTALEYLICSGDSGGGLFIDGKLAGINSSVLGYDGKPDSTYKDESCHTRVSKYTNWIKEIISNEKK